MQQLVYHDLGLPACVFVYMSHKLPRVNHVAFSMPLPRKLSGNILSTCVWLLYCARFMK